MATEVLTSTTGEVHLVPNSHFLEHVACQLVRDPSRQTTDPAVG